MSVRGLDWQPLQIPLAAGLAQGTDPRALQPPALAIAKDVEFDLAGGLQLRKPYSAMTAISTPRRIVANGDELLCFTKDTLYSWHAARSAWVSKGTHLAVKVEEEPKFVTTGDQVDADRAELNGMIVYTWSDGLDSYVACVDKTTGAVTLAPSVLNSSLRARVTALATVIILTWAETATTTLKGIVINPTSVTSDITAALTAPVTILNAVMGLNYDIEQIGSTDAAILAACRLVTTSYSVIKLSNALAVTASTKARTCDGPIAISVEPDAIEAQIVRANGTSIQGDLIHISDLSDVYTAQAIGSVGSTPVDQITMAWRSYQATVRCYVFWTSDQEVGDAAWYCESNWVDLSNTLGTEGTFLRRLAIGSRAFTHDGRVYFWGLFAGESSFSGVAASSVRSQLQNTYFLYREDGTLIAKAAATRAGGLLATVGQLPSVNLTDGTTVYSWCGIERRVVDLAGTGHSGYGARAPRDITFTFDSDDARRCARLGDTLYIAGGEIMQYDGTRLTECGFHVYPWYFGAIEVGTGDLANGTYAYKITWRWDNARGERDRSTTATSGSMTIAGGPNGVSVVDLAPIYITHKTANAIAVEVWRTAVNPTDDAPFYLVTNNDPSDTSGANCYLANSISADDLGTWGDEFADSSATTKEVNPESGGILEALSPPAASIIASNDARIFLAGVAGDPDRVWYSRRRNQGEVASFHDALTIDVPREGGGITALAFLNDALVVFRETAAYVFSGDGFDNTAGGYNYGPARTLSTDVGAVSHEAVASTPAGLLFKSNKGWYLLNRGFAMDYIGGPVSDYDSDTVVSVHVIESQHQVRCLTTSRMLVLDYHANQWAEWTLSGGLDACVWQGDYAYLKSTGPLIEQSTYSATDYGMDVETAWIKASDLQGVMRTRAIEVLGEYRSTHHLRVRIAYDYTQDGSGNWSYVDDKYWTPSPTTVGSVLQMKHGPARQQFQAIKIRLTAVNASNHATGPAGEALRLTGLGLEVGRKPGLRRLLPAAQQQ